MDSNRPVAWQVIDEQYPQAIVATFDTLDRAQNFCEKMDPDGSYRKGYRFTVQPVRSCTVPNGDR